MLVPNIDDIAEKHPELAAQVEETKKARAKKNAPETDGLLSGAARRLRELRKQRGVLAPEMVAVDDETFYIRRLSYNDTVTLACSLNRDRFGALNISDEAGMEAVTLAVLKHGIVEADGITPYFDHATAEEYLDASDQIDTVNQLFQAVVRVNPTLFATLKKKAA